MLLIIINRIQKVSLQLNTTLYLPFKPFSTSSVVYKQFIDKSKVPKLDENDIEEQFVHGSGPGGSNVNALFNCVVLKHLPTGFVVKSHEHRKLHQNRKVAREKLLTKLDDLMNGENSVSTQRKRHYQSRLAVKESSAAKLRELKLNFKIREGLADKSKNNDDIHVEGNN